MQPIVVLPIGRRKPIRSPPALSVAPVKDYNCIPSFYSWDVTERFGAVDLMLANKTGYVGGHGIAYVTCPSLARLVRLPLISSRNDSEMHVHFHSSNLEVQRHRIADWSKGVWFEKMDKVKSFAKLFPLSCYSPLKRCRIGRTETLVSYGVAEHKAERQPEQQ